MLQAPATALAPALGQSLPCGKADLQETLSGELEPFPSDPHDGPSQSVVHAPSSTRCARRRQREAEGKERACAQAGK